VKKLEENALPIRHRIGPGLALRVLLAVAVLVPVWLTPPSVAAMGKKTDRREIEARQAFAVGQYAKALDLYTELYADTVHPTYLRNVGRCYQNLKQPDQAINAFREYLRQAKQVTAGERAEVESYIAEMEAMKKEQQAALAVAKPPVTSPALTEVPVEASSLASQSLVAQPQPIPVPEPAPFYTKGWFWGVVSVAVVGGVVGGLAAGGVFTRKSLIPCKAAGGCFE